MRARGALDTGKNTAVIYKARQSGRANIPLAQRWALILANMISETDIILQAPYFGQAIVPEGSYLRALPVSISYSSRLTIDGIVFACDMLTTAYQRVREITIRVGDNAGAMTFIDRTALFSSAWSIIDNLHAVRQLYRAMLDGDDLGPLNSAFFFYSDDAHFLRNKMDHLKANIGNISKANGGGYPIFGALSYVFSHDIVAGGCIITLFAGAMRGGEVMPMVNPTNLPTVGPVDHFQISAFGKTLRLGTSLGVLCTLIEGITTSVEEMVETHVSVTAGVDQEQRNNLLSHQGANLTMVMQFTRRPSETG